MSNNLLTIREASEKTRLSKSTLYELCRQGRLVHYRVGARGRGKVLIDPDDLARLMRECRVEDPLPDDGKLKHIR